MEKNMLVGIIVLLLIVVSFAGGFYNIGKEISNLPVETLSASETNGLLQMREEEKLARDVYLTLYDTWGIQIFYNIARAEQIHMNIIKSILDKYDIQDPITDYTIGVFNNEKLEKLYFDLIAESKNSVIDALKVGAEIEDLDIYDLDMFLKETDNQDIKLVYNNLKSGSENHMRAFMSQLDRYNATYTARYITNDKLQKILNEKNNDIDN
ncbi:DUF2202 domain-containing protein [Marinitoga sp. 38H-ov]|uniref:DUF2202 domain-containing protein n=1 Tax=Marinitoga sp. 38H-ov TaxID=1755814 RepID=UPI0013EDF1DD|nr:DUF2202 domain-containing protein [Marinitoga sp. 38H-ov]KAF2955310.1 hypothetical protein AS160_10710 [Marinitoga sp. 38H-ov]